VGARVEGSCRGDLLVEYDRELVRCRARLWFGQGLTFR
jgi:hypothetical protein